MNFSGATITSGGTGQANITITPGSTSPFDYISVPLKNARYVGTYTDNSITATGTDNIIFNGQTNSIYNNANKIAVMATTNTNIAAGSNSIIAGGTNHTGDGPYSSGIIGGYGAFINGVYNFIGGGFSNNISNGGYNGIVGGSNNQIWQQGNFVGGGNSHFLFAYTNSNNCGFIGGDNNEIGSNSSNSTMLGGVNNTITGTSPKSSIIGGNDNLISGHTNSVMLGCSGRTSTTSSATFVENLVVFNYASLNYADDTAAAAGGVVLGQVYHTAGILKIRVA